MSALYLGAMIEECDVKGIIYPEPIVGAQIWVKSAIGNWGWVMSVGPEYIKENDCVVLTYEEAEKHWTEDGGEVYYKDHAAKGMKDNFHTETCPTCDNMGARHSGALCPDCDA